MEEQNPLEPTDFTLQKQCLESNIRGRPKADKTVKFTPQPKSIISRLLRQTWENNCDNKEINSNNSYNEKCRPQNSVKSKNNSIIKRPKLSSYESMQRKFTVDLTIVEDDYDNLKDTFSDGDQNNIQSDTNTDWDNKCTIQQKQEIPCYICSHRSSSHQAHRKHLSIHKNQPYACNFPNCKYTCKLSCNLIKHKRIHAPEKPYLCDQCTFRSNFANSLKVHKRIHTSERPYGCQHCGYRCNSSSNLKKHCRHKHRNII